MADAPSILVLEDDSNMQGLLMDAMEDQGYFVQGASAPNQAIELARRYRFDLVVADVRMAGMDGIDCLSLLKKAFPQLRCIVITGYASDEAPGRAIRIEVDDYLYKPFGLDDFIAAVRRVLASGKERSSYREVLSQMVAGPFRWLEKAGAALASMGLKSALEALEHERERAFQGLFVGIRSGHLNRGHALQIYDRLEQLEGEHSQLEGPEVTGKAVDSLREAYRYAFELTAAMARSRGLEAPGARRGPGQADKRLFARLFDRVKAGQVTSEQLKLAPVVRNLAPESVDRSPKLKGLYRLLWGD